MPEEKRDMPIILVIDDDDANCMVLERILKKAGLEPMIASNGKKGLECAREKKPKIILLDLFMPGDDGFGILQQFMADPNLRDIPVIIFTILEREQSKERALAMGAKDYITKPFDMRDIVDRIKKYL